MRQTFLACTVLLVVALAPVAIGARLSEVGARPSIVYYIDHQVIPDKQTQMASVAYYSSYHLEDGTHIGADYTGWGGQHSHGSSLINTIAYNVAAGVGGTAGFNFGAWAGNWAAGVMAGWGTTQGYTLALGAAAFGPYIGLALFVAGSIA